VDKIAIMDTLIIHLDTTVSKSKVKEALKMVKGIASVSDKITRSDFEALADDLLVKEMKKTDKGTLLSYEDGKKEFESIKKRARK
jgi:hypothetical protein